MRNSLYILILVCSFCSCGAPKAANKILSLELKDSVVLQIDSQDDIKMGSAYITTFKGNNCMLFWNWKGKEMLLFKLNGPYKGMMMETTALNETIATIKMNYSFCFHSNDMIFALSAPMDTVYCFDINGVIKKKWYLPRDKMKALNISRLTCGLFYDLGYYDEQKHLFYLHNCFDPMTGSVADFYKFHHFVAIDLSEDTAQIAFTFGRFPAGYTRKLYQGPSCSDKNMVFYNDKVLLNFYSSDSLFQYNSPTYSGAGYTAFNAASNDFIKDNACFDTTKNGDRDYISDYAMSNERYTVLYSRSNSEYIYRVVDKKHNRYNEDSTINFSIESPWQVVVLDKHLQIAGELFIPGKKLNSTQLIPYKNGFWIASLTDYRTFYYYEIKKP